MKVLLFPFHTLFLGSWGLICTHRVVFFLVYRLLNIEAYFTISWTVFQRTMIFWIWEGWEENPHLIEYSGPHRVSKSASFVPMALPWGAQRNWRVWVIGVLSWLLSQMMKNPIQKRDKEYLLLTGPEGVSTVSLKRDSSAMEIKSEVEKHTPKSHTHTHTLPTWRQSLYQRPSAPDGISHASKVYYTRGLHLPSCLAHTPAKVLWALLQAELREEKGWALNSFLYRSLKNERIV